MGDHHGAGFRGPPSEQTTALALCIIMARLQYKMDTSTYYLEALHGYIAYVGIKS